MPRYDYDCPDHGAFITVESMSGDHEKRPCPKCGKESPRNWAFDFFADAKWPREDWAVKPDTWDKKNKEWAPKVFNTRKQQEAFYKANGLAQVTWGGEY